MVNGRTPAGRSQLADAAECRLLHSPSSVTVELNCACVYEAWRPIGWHLHFVVHWYKHKLWDGLVTVYSGLTWTLGISTVSQRPLPVSLQSPNGRQLQLPVVRAVHGDCERVLADRQALTHNLAGLVCRWTTAIGRAGWAPGLGRILRGKKSRRFLCSRMLGGLNFPITCWHLVWLYSIVFICFCDLGNMVLAWLLPETIFWYSDGYPGSRIIMAAIVTQNLFWLLWIIQTDSWRFYSMCYGRDHMKLFNCLLNVPWNPRAPL